jgi:DNA repair protein RecO (recombination protein O)
MFHQTKGIVLSSIKYAETSIVCKIYTEKFGLTSYLVNGVRKKKGKSNYYQPLSILDLTVYYKEKSGLQRIKEANPFIQYQEIPFDIKKSSIAMFLAEILSKSLNEEEENLALFYFLETTLAELDSKEFNSQFHLQFMMELSKHLGFYPNDNNSDYAYFDMLNGQFVSSMPQHTHYLTETAVFSDLLKGQRVEPKLKKRMLDHLLEYYQLHLEGFGKIKSKEILEIVHSA